MTNNYSASRTSGLMMFVFVLFAALGLQKGAFAQSYYPMATADYSEDFANIAGWTNDYASGTGAEYWRESAAATGSTPVNAFNAFVTGTSGGVQKGTNSMLLLATGTNITCTEFLLDFTGRNAGTISLDWSKVANSASATPRPSDLTLQYSVDGGTTFVNQTEFTPVRIFNNSTVESGSLTSIALPSSMNGVANVVIRFKAFVNGSDSGSGNRPKFQIDNIVVTSTPGAAAPTVTASVATLPDFGSVNVGSTSASQSFTVDASDLVADVTVAVGGDYQVSLDNTNWFSSVDIPMGSGTLTGVTVYVQFAPLSSGVQSNTVTLSTSGSAGDFVGVIGTGAATSSELSDIIVDPTFVYPTNIDYASYQETDLTASSLEVARFLVRDGGASAPDADAVGTLLNTLDFSVTNSSVLRRVALYVGASEFAEVDAAGVLNFSGMPIVPVSDDTEVAISIRVSFQDVVNDNTQFDFTITGAAADITGSRFAASNGGGAATSTAGDDNRVEVTASLLTFTTQPSTTVVNTGMGDVIVRAFDALGNRDFDFAGDISITSSGALVGTPVVVTAASGSATFSALTHSAAANGLTLTAASTGLTSATSLAFDITSAPILTFEMAGIAGNEVSHNSATNDPAINISTLTRGSGVVAGNNGDRFNASSWPLTATLDADSYMEFTISPVDANSAFSVERIFIAIARSGSGPGAIELRSSLDGYTSDLGGSFSIVDNTSAQTFEFNFTQALASQTVTYRVYMYAAEADNGTGGIGDFTGNDIEVYGTTAVLECNDPGACNYNAGDTNADGCIFPIAYYIDADFDGYASGTEITCTPGAGYTIDVLPLGDCDDNNFDVNPGVAEDLCNGIDDNCDTNIDEGAVVGCTDPLASNYNAGATCPGPCSYAGSYTAGNLVAIRGGDGSATLPTSGSGHDTYLEQMDTDGNTVSLLPLTNGPTRLATNLGSTASGFISRTQDATSLVVAGYDIANGDAISGADRVANLVDIDYTVTRLFADASVHAGSNNIRGAASNGTDVWTAGNSSGIYHAGPGTPEVISNNSTNNRVIKQINGDLYFSTNSTAAGAVGIYRIAGSPTTGSTAATLVVGTGGNPYDFEFSPNGKSLYVADDNASSGGVKKYTFDGSSWNLAATYTVLNYGSVSGLAIDFTGSTPVIYAVSRNTSTNETIIVSFFDDNVTGDVAFNTLKLDDYLTVRYRDIEFAPCNGTTWYEDADGDGYGNPNVSIVDCMQPFGFVAVAGDCNDNLYYVNPGATELCGNNQDDDCDGTINEGCPVGGPSNDEFVLATAVSSPNFPYCSNKTVNLTNATPSPEATTVAPVGAGQDVWYAFVATTNGARITSTSVACDVVLELHDAAHNVYGVENETTSGSEILVANNLTPGTTYYVLVRNFNTSSVGSVTTCIQNLAYSAPNNGTSFGNLCSYIKCSWNGAQLYTITLTAEDGITTYTASSTATQIPFSLFGDLEYGATYTAVFTTTFIQNDAAGNSTTVVTVSPSWMITILDHAPAALRSIDRAPATRNIGTFIGTDTWICGIVGYQWEFTLSDNLGNPVALDPVIVDVNSASRYVRTSSISGVQPGDFYMVRVRPMFSYGPGTFGNAYLLSIAGSAGIATEGGNATPSLTSVNAERSVKLYPNPNNGEMINIQLTGITSETVQVNVIDALGRVVTTNQYSVNNTFNGTILFDTKLSAGMYNVQIIDGETVMTERMIIR